MLRGHALGGPHNQKVVMRLHITPISQISADGTPAWTRFHGPLDTEVTSDGDIVMDLLDLIEMGNATARIRSWVRARSLRVQGADMTTAVLVLWACSVGMALDEEAGQDQIHDVAEAMMESGIDFRVLMNGDFAIAQLNDYFDGRFATPEGQAAKGARRLGRVSQERLAEYVAAA